MDDNLRREFLKRFFGIDLEGPSYTFTSADSADQPRLTLETLGAVYQELEKAKKFEETRKKLESGEYDGIIRPEVAQESGLPIQKDEDEREYIQVLETKFYITPHCPGEAVAYMIPKLKDDWFSPVRDIIIQTRFTYGWSRGWTFTDPPP